MAHKDLAAAGSLAYARNLIRASDRDAVEMRKSRPGIIQYRDRSSHITAGKNIFDRCVVSPDEGERNRMQTCPYRCPHFDGLRYVVDNRAALFFLIDVEHSDSLSVDAELELFFM